MQKGCFLLPSLFVLCAGTGSAATQYELIDLGTLGTDSCANAISSNGIVGGYSTVVVGDSTEVHGFLHPGAGGTMQDLGTIYDYPYTVNGVNSSGTTVGMVWQPGYYGARAVVRDSYGFRYIFDETTMSEAKGINDAGQITGWVDVEVAEGEWQMRPFVHHGSSTTILPTFGVGEPGSGQGFGISANGLVTGYLVTDGEARAFLYSGGIMQNLGSLGGHSYGTAVNDAGWVAGYCSQNIDPYWTGWVWNGSEMIDLGVFGGGDASQPHPSFGYGINNLGQVVGFAECTMSGTGVHTYGASLWEDGVLYNLNDLIDPGSGWHLEAAYAINDGGQIVGYGYNDSGVSRAFLLNPVPEPGTIVGLAAGIAFLARLRRRSRR